MEGRKQTIFLLLVAAVGIVAFVLIYRWDPEVSRLKDLDAKQALALANEYRLTRPDVRSYVTPREVVFELDRDRVVTIPLPEDKMVIAVAPYLNMTHTCKIHYMSSCQGELAGILFDVTITDESDQVVFDNKMITLANGFFEIWLPRNKKYKMVIRQGDRSADGFISTTDQSNTCVTTFHLS